VIAKNLAFAISSINVQRAALLTAVAEERRAILETLASERAAVLAAIASERSEALRGIEGIVGGSLENARATSDTAIDRLFNRALLLIVAALVAAVAYRFISVKIIGPRRS
jgi:hypothetical protein